MRTAITLSALALAFAVSPALAVKTVTGVAWGDPIAELAIGACSAANNTGNPIAVTISARESPGGRLLGSERVTVAPFGNRGIAVPEDTNAWTCHFQTGPEVPKGQFMGSAVYWQAESGFNVVLDR